MASNSTEDRTKASSRPISQAPKKEELSAGELDKVVGGLKKNIGVKGPKSGGIIGDPCAGGE